MHAHVWCVWYVCVCTGTLMCAQLRLAGRSLPFSLCGFLSEATWCPDPPQRVLLKQLSAHSIAHRLHERAFILHSALFFNQHSSFTCLSGQIASFVFVPLQATKLTTQRRVFFFLVILFHLEVFIWFWNAQVKHNETGVRTCTAKDRLHHHHRSFKVRSKKQKASAWHPCFFFSFLMSFREGALHCLFCISRQGRPYCLWKSQWERGWGAPSKTLAHHRSALPAPLAN